MTRTGKIIVFLPLAAALAVLSTLPWAVRVESFHGVSVGTRLLSVVTWSLVFAFVFSLSRAARFARLFLYLTGAAVLGKIVLRFSVGEIGLLYLCIVVVGCVLFVGYGLCVTRPFGRPL